VALVAACAAGTGIARADVSGFGGTPAAGYTLNGGATVSGPGDATDVLTLTDGAQSEARSAYDNTLHSYGGGFTVNFTYQGTGPAGNTADGSAFVLQNSAAGPSALGASGGGLGVGGGMPPVVPSSNFDINIYPNNTPGVSFNSNGGTGAYVVPGAVNPGSQDPINVTLTYNPTTYMVTQTLADPTAGTTSTYSYHEVLSNLNNSGLAYVGFSGGTGGGVSTQTITNFTYTANNLTPSPFVLRDSFAASDGTSLNGHVPDVGGGAWNVTTDSAPGNLAIVGQEVNTSGAARVAAVPFTTPLGAHETLTVSLHEDSLGGFFGHLAGFDLLAGGSTKLFFGAPTNANAGWSVATDNNGDNAIASANTQQSVDVTLQYEYDTGLTSLYVNNVLALTGTEPAGLAIDSFGFENNNGGDVHFGNLAVTETTVPEPASLSLLGLAALGLLSRRRRHA
jgi:hypothetical protein